MRTTQTLEGKKSDKAVRIMKMIAAKYTREKTEPLRGNIKTR